MPFYSNQSLLTRHSTKIKTETFRISGTSLKHEVMISTRHGFMYPRFTVDFSHLPTAEWERIRGDREDGRIKEVHLFKRVRNPRWAGCFGVELTSLREVLRGNTL